MSTAIQKLAPSRLDLTNAELLTDNLDIKQLMLTLTDRIHTDLEEAITDVKIERTIEGASTVTVSCDDHSRKFLREGNLSDKLDINLDGLFFRLAGVNKTADSLDLIFEEREIALLRTYVNPPTFLVSRTVMTRAEFILKLLKEVKEERLRYVIPQLHTVQPIEIAKAQGKTVPSYTPAPGDPGAPGSQGIPDNPIPTHAGGYQTPGAETLTVKGARATSEQIRNANIILNVGTSLGARRKVLVTAIMVAIQENSIINDTDKTHTHVGVFQQSSAWGSFADRTNVATAARLFFLGPGWKPGAIKDDQDDPTLPYYLLGEKVQASGLPNLYAPWRTEGERFANAYGNLGGDSSSSDAGSQNNQNQNPVSTDQAYYFYRGIPPTSTGQPWQKEDSWTCIQRLADEVRWRAFFLSGVFYYMDEFTLFRSQPRMTLFEEMDGIQAIDFNYDSNKKAATITIQAHLARWGAPPGSVVILTDMGPCNGRWLTESVSRSIFSPYATVTLSKPRPKLPEPVGPDLPKQAGGQGWTTGAPSDPRGTGYVNPFASSTSLRPGRIDQGVDYSGRGPIGAVGDGIVKGVYNAGWPGGMFIYYELTSGPYAGSYVYVAEGINPSVTVGEHIIAGQTIGTFIVGSSTGIETGWATAAGGPLDPYGGRPDGTPTEGGKSFAAFLDSLGAPTVATGP